MTLGSKVLRRPIFLTWKMHLTHVTTLYENGLASLPRLSVSISEETRYNRL